MAPQQTRGVGPMLSWCWASVVDDGPTPAQHWANALCLLGQCICVCWDMTLILHSCSESFLETYIDFVIESIE